jgi:hypothetical protein
LHNPNPGKKQTSHYNKFKNSITLKEKELSIMFSFSKMFFSCIVIICLAISSAVALPPNPVAYYPFNGNANDESGNGNHGTPEGGVTPTTDRFGNQNSAYDFDGVDDKIDFGDLTILEESSLHISVWIYPRSTTNDNNAQPIINKAKNSDRCLLIMHRDDENIISVQLFTNTGTYSVASPANSINLSEWSLVNVDYNGATLSLYINNQLQATADCSGTIINNSQPLEFGHNIGHGSSGTHRWCHGKIDDIRIYDYALTESEIQELYQEGGWDPVQYRLTKHLVETEPPCFVNIMFQVTDMQNEGIDTLQTDDFEVLEDGEPVSPSESAMHIRKRETVPYDLKTVLMLDNSTSIGDDLDQVKQAAIALVNNITDQQEIAILRVFG